MTARKVDPMSEYNQEQIRLQNKYGPAFRSGKDWTNEATDALLELYLVEGAYYRDYLVVCGRTWRSVRAQLWKLAVNYDRPSVRRYSPENRTSRSNWTDRDLSILFHATSPIGITNKAHDPYRLGRVLGRRFNEVRQYLERLGKRRASLFLLEDDSQIEAARLIEAAHETIRIHYRIKGL